ncbi:MAG: hypothetical protein SPK03_02390, partial [Alloprevotella sp.]|nr:hypothetical protein [Alloprevotella sp.]
AAFLLHCAWDFIFLDKIGCTSAMPRKILRLFFGYCLRFALSLRPKLKLQPNGTRRRIQENRFTL